MASETFIRYIITSPVGFHWWGQLAKPFLSDKGWDVIEPATFSYKASYGFEPDVIPAHDQLTTIEYSLNNATAIAEYHGEPIHDSIFDPDIDRTIIDDLLAFMSIYDGVYWQYMWREFRDSATKWKASYAWPISHDHTHRRQACERNKSLSFFQKALTTIPNLDRRQFELAIRWFFSALRECEAGRPLVEAALNWVCLESQANYLGLPGNKFQKVESLLNNQGFPAIPRLSDLYQLRNNAFHDGQLLTLSETDAQAARTAGRALARAQILNLVGMTLSDFKGDFIELYTS